VVAFGAALADPASRPRCVIYDRRGARQPSIVGFQSALSRLSAVRPVPAATASRRKKTRTAIAMMCHLDSLLTPWSSGAAGAISGSDAIHLQIPAIAA
jgi:hypothetical protein